MSPTTSGVAREGGEKRALYIFKRTRSEKKQFTCFWGAEGWDVLKLDDKKRSGRYVGGGANVSKTPNSFGMSFS